MKITLEIALAAYRLESASLGHSPEYTRVNFVYLGKLQAVCEAHSNSNADSISLKAITPEVITEYFSGLQGLVQSSQNRGLTSVSSFLRYCEQRDWLRAGTTARLLRGRKTKTAIRKRKHYIPAAQFGDMLELAGRRHPADRAMTAVALYTLARQGEIASIRFKDVDWANRVIRIHRHKRNRWTDVTMCPDLMDELVIWLETYANEAAPSELYSSFLPGHPDWHLIPHLEIVRNKGTYRTGQFRWELDPTRPMARMENVVKNALDVLGADTEDGIYVRHLGEGMHTIRRSGARAMFDYLTDEVGEAKALLQVSIMLDHDDPQMTLRYIDKDVERDRLNTFLKTGSMYGPGHRARPEGNVVQLHRAMGE